MSSKLTLVASLRATPGQSEELGRRLNALVEPTRAEAGCINYDLHRSNEDRAVWMLYENWRSAADLNAHFETPYLKEARLAEVVEGDMDLRRLTMTTEPVDSRD
jgi:quinol monooxygenase YgiN